MSARDERLLRIASRVGAADGILPRCRAATRDAPRGLMRLLPLRRYVLSCGLLLLPIFVWNLAFTRFLPSPWGTSEFWRDIPGPLAYQENVFRLIVSLVPFLMPLEMTSAIQRRGLVVTGVGVVLYFCAWAAIMLAPHSPWASSSLGFLAPAYTPLIWLVGLALLGQRLFWGRFYRWWMFLVPAGAFITAHVRHTALVYARIL